LVYQCLGEDSAFAAIEWLGYSNEMKKLLGYGVGLMGELDRISDKTELKRLINRIGREYYRYLTDLSEQRLKVYCLGDEAFRRRELFREISAGNEPVFLEDLAVNGDDLLRSGIRKGAEVGTVLKLLLETVHYAPEKNKRDLLLKIAAENYVEHKE
jgi:tRNA nucleotidyltransferase (CCA-adding enzyme)